MPTHQCRPPIATGLPASQCLQVPHLSTDSSLSFASKLMFLQLLKSRLVVLSYSCANISMLAPHTYWFLPASQCLLVHHPFTDISLSFAPKIMFLGLFESSLVGRSYPRHPLASLSSPTSHSMAILLSP